MEIILLIFESDNTITRFILLLLRSKWRARVLRLLLLGRYLLLLILLRRILLILLMLRNLIIGAPRIMRFEGALATATSAVLIDDVA